MPSCIGTGRAAKVLEGTELMRHLGHLQGEKVRQSQLCETALGWGEELSWQKPHTHRHTHARTYLSGDAQSCTSSCCTGIFNTVFHLHESWLCLCV